MFERNINLIGEDKFNKLKTKKVLIVGIGGVGGYALETLVRSGIHFIDIIDFDKIDITNLNRQIVANQNNISNLKVDEALIRAKSINPNVIIKTYSIFLNKDNINELINKKYDYIIDACDSVDTKLELIRYSIESNLSVAIANFNAYTKAGTNFQMPKLILQN